MSKKDFDLSDYSSQTKEKAQSETTEVTEEKMQATEQNTSETKEKRVNMAFSDNNYEFILNLYYMKLQSSEWIYVLP